MAKEVYCEIVGKAKGLFGQKVEIDVDFGQKKGFFESISGNPLKDDSGKIVSFNSMIDALNHMGERGWLFVNAYYITVKDQNVYHYVMRKPVD